MCIRDRFYPVTVPADQDADLTVIEGQAGRAAGQLLYVSGRVVNTRGEPVADAVIEIWQANAAGRYAPPGDDSGGLSALACLGGGFGRTMSPVAAVVVYCSGLVGVSPILLVKRLAPALLAGATVSFTLVGF